MRCQRQGVACWLFTVMMIALWVSVAGAETGMVEGTISLQTKDGETIPGDWIRILLVRKPVSLPASPATNICPGEDLKPKAREDIVNAHMDFFKAVRNQQANPDYLADATLSTNSGTFKFVAVDPGHYHIVVTFPSLINDYKVAWQVPVTVVSGETASVRLDHTNLALPSYSRK